MGIALSSHAATPLATTAAPTASPLPGVLSPVTRVTNPLEHVLALWPGFEEGIAFGSKAIFPVPHPKHADHVTDQIMYVRRQVAEEEKARDYEIATRFIQSQEDQVDKYISVNTFSGRRLHEKLKCLTAFYVDLDLKEAPSYGQDFMKLRQDALDALSAARVPQPNLAVHTGRGVHLYWLFDRIVPGQAFQRWKVATKVLLDLLRPVGADPKVCDSPRILRLVGTLNSKCPVEVDGRTTLWKTTCEVLNPQRYAFDWLCDQILPHTREEWIERKAARAAQALVELGPLQATKRMRVRSEGTKPAQGRTGRHYSATAITRLADLEFLANTLYPNGIKEGRRDHYLFHAAVNLAWICREQTLETEVLRWKERHVPDMTDSTALAMMGAVMRRAYSAYKGDTVGVYDDARYVISADRLWRDFRSDIELAGLTQDMRTILPADVRQARAKEARRAANAEHYTRAGIRRENIQLAIQAIELSQAGQSTRAIGEVLGKSNKTIAAWLKLPPEALGLAVAPAAPANSDGPDASYPQATFKTTALPKLHLNNGEANRFLEPLSMKGVGISPPNQKISEKTEKSSARPERESGSPVSPVQTRIDQQAGRSQSNSSSPPGDNSGAPSGSIPTKKDHTPMALQPRLRPFDPQSTTGNSSKGRSPYLPELLSWLRELEVTRALDILEVHYKLDVSFKPKKNMATTRLHVSVPGGGVFELVCTGNQFIEKTSEKGLKGAGAIDLAMYLLDLKFDQAMQRLLRSTHVPIGLKSSRK